YSHFSRSQSDRSKRLSDYSTSPHGRGRIKGSPSQNLAALRLVFFIGGADRGADVPPFGVAKLCERREITASCEMQAAIDGDGLAGEIVAAIRHQENREIGKLRHLPDTAHRIDA